MKNHKDEVEAQVSICLLDSLQNINPYFDLPKSITCAGFLIREYDNEIPSSLTAEEILIRSGNIGSVRIGQKLEIDKLKSFLEKVGVLNI